MHNQAPTTATRWNPLIHTADTLLQSRFVAHLPVLTDRLQRLYGNQPDFDAWMHRLLQRLMALHDVRSAPLRELDAARSHTPRWFMDQHQVGYCAYVDRFGGTLQGVTGRIPHLQSLGVTYLHLLPFLRARPGDNDGGFAVTDFEQIEPALGTMHDLHELTAALRSAGISLCSDFILNHVADTHDWAVAAKAGDPAMHAYFCTLDDQHMVQQVEPFLNQVFPQTAPGNFTYSPELKKWVWTTFYPYQWDLNYANPEVFTEMLCTMLSLANHGIEVFRLDSTAYLWKRSGTSCMNQPEVHWILQAMRAAMDIVAPAVLLKAEAIVQTDQLGAYLGSVTEPGTADLPLAGAECHLAYHSTLMASSWVALATGQTELLRRVIAGTPAPTMPASWLTYVRCHDDIGWNVLQPEALQSTQQKAQNMSAVLYASQLLSGMHGGFGRGVPFQSSAGSALHGTNGTAAALAGLRATDNADERAAARDRLMLLYGLACCFGGMPLIYMGDELGQDNDLSYLDDPAHCLDSRWIQRPRFDEYALAQLTDSDTLPAQQFGALRNMLTLRSRLPALAADAPRRLLQLDHPALLAIQRGAANPDGLNVAALLFVGNFSATAVSLNLEELEIATPSGNWQDGLHNNLVSTTLVLQPWSQVWLVPKIPTGDQP